MSSYAVNKRKYLKYLQLEAKNLLFWVNKGHEEFIPELNFYEDRIKKLLNNDLEVDLYEN